ncbi:hypothetical protein CC117_24535 [Parafrankia colletiae]|uniref:Ig-like domain-containing protein n=1 Tax=Parafrankia colletiae TaxID=573497 RepID=A0A1S1QH26_9ACTN|nr:hypothetical protein [Parafrankia colletiae]MCK9901647.1 hypothetical protein [Frankia sp. Cpl3]OHV32741.1 hypothetical protein CC117_24535 [Parafrankia colletiae]
MHQQRRVRAGAAVLTGGLLLASAACRGQVGDTTADPPPPAGANSPAASTQSSASAAAASAAEPEAAPAGAGTGGAGSLSISITSPVTIAGHVSTPVSCQTGARRYVESATGATGGATVTQSVRVAAYSGPGTYPALVTVSVLAADSERYAVEAAPASVTITQTGGSVDFSAATAAGRSLSGSISWACSAN